MKLGTRIPLSFNLDFVESFFDRGKIRGERGKFALTTVFNGF